MAGPNAEHAALVESIDFNAETHTYKLDGKRIPSVTTVLGILGKAGLIPWAAMLSAEHIRETLCRFFSRDGIVSASVSDVEAVCNEGKSAFRRKSEAGAYKGSIVHDAIALFHDDWESFERPDVDPEVRNSIDCFLRWYRESDYEILESERVVLGREGRYVGTTDLVLRHNETGDIVIGDVKTNKASKSGPYGIYPEHSLQVAAYADAYEYETGHAVSGTLIIHCGRDRRLHTLDRNLDKWHADEVVWAKLFDCYQWAKDSRRMVTKEVVCWDVEESQTEKEKA